MTTLNAAKTDSLCARPSERVDVKCPALPLFRTTKEHRKEARNVRKG